MARMDTDQMAAADGRGGWNLAVSYSCSFVPFVAALLLAGCQPTPESAGSVVAGRNALGAGQFDAAVADADDYLRGQPHGPDAAEAYYIKGQALQNKSFLPPVEGRRRALLEARTAYQAGLAERQPSPRLQGNLRTGLSTVALYQDDFPTAIEQADKAIPLVEGTQTKAGLLYNEGVAQQRLGRFADADQTFRQVQAQYPATAAAVEAKRHERQRAFYVQLSKYASAADADRATLSLRAGGAVVSRSSDATGATVLCLGPFSTYAAAKQQADAQAATFPMAIVIP